MKTERASGERTIGDLVQAATRPEASPAERNRAFGEIIARFQDMAFGTAFALLGDADRAQDAAQDAFIAAWRQLENLREPDAFPGWFHCIVRTHCHRQTRGKRLSLTPYHLMTEATASAQSDPVWQAEQQERKQIVHTALAHLPEHERTATVLYYLNDAEQSEIAAFLEVPVTTIKKRVFTARKRLRERIFPYMAPQEIVQETMNTKRPSRSDQFSRRVLFWAATGDGDTAEITRLLQEDPTLVTATNTEGETPLHLSAYCGYTGAVQTLLHARSPVNHRANNGQTSLHALAAGSADQEIAGLLLHAGADLAQTDVSGETPLSLAVRFAIPQEEDGADHFGLAEFFLSRGATLDLCAAAALDRAEDIRRLCETDSHALTRPDAIGDLPLHIAARAGFRRTVNALLQVGADIEARNRDGKTALSIAAAPGREIRLAPRSSIVTLLRGRGANVDLPTAILLGDLEKVKTLLQEMPEAIHQTDPTGATPLHIAAWNGLLELVQALLHHGANPQAKDQSNRTPLSVRWQPKDVSAPVIDLLLAAGAPMELRTALALGRARAMESLLSADHTLADEATIAWAVDNEIPIALIERLVAFGGKLTVHQAAALGMTDLLSHMISVDQDLIRRRDEERRTPLHMAAMRGQVNTVRFLCERGAYTEAIASDGATPLHLACASGHLAAADALLTTSAIVDSLDHRGETPLFAACASGHTDIVRLLLAHGATVDRAAAGKNTPLHAATQSGSLPVAQLLLDAGANKEARNFFGAAPLHIAVREGHDTLVTALLEAGAERTARDQWHRTPLHVAAWFDRPTVAGILLDAGVSVTELSYGFSTPLHTAAERGSVAVGERLIAHGADINARTDFGRTPLHDAVNGGNIEMVSLLLARGADPTSPNNRQITPLHWAAASGKTESAALLIAAGADTSVRSHKDETPLDLARRYGHTEIIPLLESRNTT